MKKIKLIFLTSGIGLGGVEKVLIEYLKNINLDKFDIKLALHSEKEKFFEKEIPKGIKFKYMQSLKLENKIFKLEKGNYFQRKILREIYKKWNKYLMLKNYNDFSKDREVVIDFKDGKYFKYIQDLTNKKIICWLHGNIEDIYNLKSEKEKIEKRLQKTEKIICICKEMAEGLVKVFPSLKNKIEVIYNPFDVYKIKKESNIEKQRKIEKYILMVARLDNKQKDFFTLIKAYEYYLKLTKSQNNELVKLYILGDGKDREIIEQEINKRNLSDMIKLIGSDKNPYFWIKNAEILVHSSNWEGLPTVLIEGLILNKLIVATECKTGPKEILKEGKYGILVPVRDHIKMGNSIKELLSKNSNIREYLEKNIREKECIDRFLSKNILKEVEVLLETIK